MLSEIAKTSPKNEYSFHTKVVQNKLRFQTETTTEAFQKMDETEKNVKHPVIPSITGKNHITDKNRSPCALPLRMKDWTSSVTRTFQAIMSVHKPFVIRLKIVIQKQLKRSKL